MCVRISWNLDVWCFPSQKSFSSLILRLYLQVFFYYKTLFILDATRNDNIVVWGEGVAFRQILLTVQIFRCT